jgi:hypothetical protein
MTKANSTRSRVRVPHALLCGIWIDVAALMTSTSLVIAHTRRQCLINSFACFMGLGCTCVRACVRVHRDGLGRVGVQSHRTRQDGRQYGHRTRSVRVMLMPRHRCSLSQFLRIRVSSYNDCDCAHGIPGKGTRQRAVKANWNANPLWRTRCTDRLRSPTTASLLMPRN